MSSLLALTRSRLATRAASGSGRVNVKSLLTRQTVASASPFHSSASHRLLSEADKNRENIEPEIESAKEENLRKHQKGDARWHEELASSSEADVKADRNEMPDPKQTSAMEDAIRDGNRKREAPARPRNQEAGPAAGK